MCVFTKKVFYCFYILPTSLTVVIKSHPGLNALLFVHYVLLRTLTAVSPDLEVRDGRRSSLYALWKVRGVGLIPMYSLHLV